MPPESWFIRLYSKYNAAGTTLKERQSQMRAAGTRFASSTSAPNLNTFHGVPNCEYILGVIAEI
jgi:hypothetical protein